MATPRVLAVRRLAQAEAEELALGLLRGCGRTLQEAQREGLLDAVRAQQNTTSLFVCTRIESLP